MIALIHLWKLGILSAPRHLYNILLANVQNKEWLFLIEEILRSIPRNIYGQ